MRVPVHGAVLGVSEKNAIIEVANAEWYTHGRKCEQFESMLAEYIGVKHAAMCNSGSSANLLALSALTAPELGDRRIKPGDEVITTALAFPTTVNPIIQVGAVPVFVDVYENMMPNLFLESAITPKTKAIIFCHTLGFSFNARWVKNFCVSKNLWFIEDCCDALGSEINGRKCGSFGDFSTFSFYTAHHIMTGEGGAVCTSNSALAKIAVSFRDWGRDCTCKPGQDNACGRRYEGGYDHKYTFSHIGYNLKATEFQGALGCIQMREIDQFEAIRKRNYSALAEAGLDKYLDLPYPVLPEGVSPFGFPMYCRGNERMELMRYLERHEVGNRMVFGGNLLRQPAYKNNPDIRYRVVGHLTETDYVHDRGFFVGCWHGIGVEHVDYVCEHLKRFYEK